MKKLSKIALKGNGEVLNENEMKRIVGGSLSCQAESCGGPCMEVVFGVTVTGYCNWTIAGERMVCACRIY